MIVRRKLTNRTFLATLIGAGMVLGCTNNTGIVDGRDPGNGAMATQEISGRGGGESGEEHSPGGGSAAGSQETNGANLVTDQTFDVVRGGPGSSWATTRRAMHSMAW